MAVLNPTFAVRRGDDCEIEIAVKDVDGNNADLSGALIEITYGLGKVKIAARTHDSPDTLIAPDGKITMRMRPDETNSLSAGLAYWFNVRVIIGDFHDTVTTGLFNVL